MKLLRGSSDAALMPYHVDRSKLFVMDRLGDSRLVDAARISRAMSSLGFQYLNQTTKMTKKVRSRGPQVSLDSLVIHTFCKKPICCIVNLTKSG